MDGILKAEQTNQVNFCPLASSTGHIVLHVLALGHMQQFGWLIGSVQI